MPSDSAPAASIRAFSAMRQAWGDLLFRGLCGSAAGLVVVLMVCLIITLTIEAMPFLSTVNLDFLQKVAWNPGITPPSYGGLALIYGTLATSAIAMLVAVPLGVATAAYLAEVAPVWLRGIGSGLVELLAAIPSVVYGLWGLLFLAPRLGGPGLLSAGLILAIMVLPYIVALTFDACLAVPQAQREGALALGATRWQMVKGTVLPYARSGIVAACFLALGRALGETMAVTMLVGNKALTIESPLGGVGDSIASVIANQLNEARDEIQRSGLVALGLLLFLVTVAVNIFARYLTRDRRFLVLRRRGRRARALSRIKPETVAKPVGGLLPETSTRSNRVDRLMTGVLGASLAVSLLPLFLILGNILVRGLPGLNVAFFTHRPAPIGEPGGGLAHAMIGSAIMVGLATLGAVPIAILAGIFLSEFRSSRLAKLVRFTGELLGSVPSIIFGILAYSLIVARSNPPHFSGWAGAFALALMMIPTIMRTSEEALRTVPESLRSGSYALGASQMQTIFRVALPASLPAIVTGVFLAIARVAGETAPLLLTALGSSYFPRSLDEEMPFLSKYIYDFARSGYSEQEQQAWAAALLLLTVVLFLNVGIRLSTGKRFSATRGR